MEKMQILGALAIFYLLLMTPLLVFSFDKDLWDKYGGGTEKDYLGVISFLENNNDDPGDFSEEEASHLMDVRKIFNWVRFIFALSLIVCIVSLATLWSSDKLRFWKIFKYGGAAALGLVILISISALLSFESSWTAFHKIFFPQGNWSFPHDSLIITLFPPIFFEEISFRALLTSGILSTIFLVFGRYQSKSDNSSSN